ncbi:MAG: hypothetical protein L3J58_12720 [Emcibacter sp.]|nr:hypothetical protein [Emcibacter sp.]
MLRIKENPGAAPTAHRANSKFSVSLYNSSKKSAQARLARRYRISHPHAVVIADILNLGGATNG